MHTHTHRVVTQKGMRTGHYAQRCMHELYICIYIYIYTHTYIQIHTRIHIIPTRMHTTVLKPHTHTHTHMHDVCICIL